MRRAVTIPPRSRIALVERLLAEPDWRILAPLFTAVAVLLVAAAVTIALQQAYADRVAAGVQVLGVDVGGRSKAQARAVLQAGIAEVLRQPVTLRGASREWWPTARDLGATFDPDAMVEVAYAVGREGNALRRITAQWGALLMGQRFGATSLYFDLSQQEAALWQVAADVDRAPRDARLEVVTAGDGPSATVRAEEPGLRLLIPETGERVRQAIQRGLPASADLALVAEAPAIAAVDLRALKAQTDRILAAPLVLTYQERRWTLGRDDIARMVTFDEVPGQLPSAALNPDALKGTFDRIGREVEQPGQNARFDWAGGNLRVIREGRDGLGLDLEALRVQMREHLLADERQMALPMTVARPLVASGDGARLGIRERIREGRTSFPGSVPEKQHNIRLAASRLHGTVVPPGATFSFNREVGPTTLDAGFRTGWGIVGAGSGARTIPAVAGGICQVATTLFHPVFHAGYSIEQRHSHLYWIQSYGQPPLGMPGLDATVDEDSRIDLQFINTTADYVLIQARVDGTTLVFGLYGTKPTWKVQIDGPTITNVVPANRTPVTQPEPSMPAGRTLQVEAAQDGFDATIVRTVTQGEDTRTLRLRSHYAPSRNVVLEGTGGA